MSSDLVKQDWPSFDTHYSVPMASSADIGTIPNNPMVAAILAAIFKGGQKARNLANGWTTDEDGRLVYRHVGKRGGQIQVYCDLGEFDNGASDIERLESQVEFVESLSSLTADVLIMVLSQLCAPSVGNKSKFPLLKPVAVSAKTLIKNKKITRWGHQRAEFRKRIGDEISKIGRIRCDVLQYPGWDPNLRRWNHKGVSIIGDVVLDIADAPKCGHGHYAAGDEVWFVRAGQWSQWWLNFQGKVWTSPMPENLVVLDHRANRGIDVLAKKIGMNTHLLWGAFRNRQKIERRIDHLLEDIGELPNPWNRENHWAGRMRDRCEEALLRLQEQNIFGEIQWHGNFGPGDPDRKKGWVDRWLSTKITIYRPSRGSVQTKSSKKPNRRKNDRKGLALNGDGAGSGLQIRELRTHLFMTQKQLARKLQISPSMLSQIENGRRSVPAHLFEALTDLNSDVDSRN